MKCEWGYSDRGKKIVSEKIIYLLSVDEITSLAKNYSYRFFSLPQLTINIVNDNFHPRRNNSISIYSHLFFGGGRKLFIHSIPSPPSLSSFLDENKFSGGDKKFVGEQIFFIFSKLIPRPDPKILWREKFGSGIKKYLLLDKKIAHQGETSTEKIRR